MVSTVDGVSLHDLIKACIGVAVAVQGGGDMTVQEEIITLTEFAVLGWQSSTPDATPASPAALEAIPKEMPSNAGSARHVREPEPTPRQQPRHGQ